MNPSLKKLFSPTHLKRGCVILIAGVALLATYKYYQYRQVVLAAQNLPNIIFILADDIAWNDYSFTGHPIIKTPHIDQLAKEGVVFNNGYTPNSICRPSLASIITGLYPYQHRIKTNGRRLNQINNPYNFGKTPYSVQMDTLNTLPRELSKLGYRSLQTGKWWEEAYTNGGFNAGDKESQGFFRQVTRKNAIGRIGLNPIYNFIEEDKKHPFFIWYAPQMPHDPYNAPQKWIDQYQGKTDIPEEVQYWAMISWFDDTIGELRSYLKDHQLSDNTLIVYLSDNGVLINNDPKNPGVKDTPYDPGNRTPIIFNWPKANWAPPQRNTLVSSIDIFPTIMDILHHPLAQSSGISLMPILTENKQPERNFVAGEGYFNSGENLESQLAFRWIRSDQWKLIVRTQGEIELYDISQDPNETINLAYQEKNIPLQSHLLALLKSELPDLPSRNN